MNWLTFTCASLACFRLTRLITDDKIFDWLRRDVAKAGKKAKEGIECPFCVSFYFSLIISVALCLQHFFYLDHLWLWLFAIWGASVLFNQLFCYLSKG